MDSCPSVALESIFDMCVHGGTKKGESHANADVYFQCKAKAFEDKTRFAELETFRLDLVTVKV